MTALIGITGYAQHGKDTIGNRLVAHHAFHRYAFADTLKSMALTLDPIIPCTLFVGDQALGSQSTARLSELVQAVGWEDAKRQTEVRRFLQVLGTEGVRDHLGTDSWVNALGTRIVSDDPTCAVITDVRFPNEASWVKRNGGLLVRVERYVDGGLELFDNGIGRDHPSERHVASLPVDIVLQNDGDVTDLEAKVDALAADFAEGFAHAEGFRGPHMPTRDELRELFS